MRFFRRIVLATLAAVAACQSADPGRPEVRVGVIGRSLESNEIDPSVRAGVELALAELEAEELPDELGRLVPVYAGDDGTREGAAEAAHRLIASEQVVAIIGPGRSRTALAVSRVADAEGIPMLSAGSSHPETTNGKPYSFRLGVRADDEAEALGKLSLGPLGASRFAVLFEESDVFCRSVAEAYRQWLAANGGDVVAYEPYVSGIEDFSEAILRMREAGAEVILLPNYLDDTVRQARQIRSLALDVSLVGTDALDVTLLENEEKARALEALEGMYIGLIWHPDQPGDVSRRFVASYQDRTGSAPAISSAFYYEAVKILHAAVRQSGSIEPDGIRAGLLSGGPFGGVFGPFEFSADGEPGLVPTIFRVEHGAMRFFSRVPN